jgi:uncharacterized protein (DUF2062 family)
MDHDGFMMGMLIGGALVALVPILLVVGVGIYAFRHHRAQQRDEPSRAQTREV